MSFFLRRQILKSEADADLVKTGGQPRNGLGQFSSPKASHHSGGAVSHSALTHGTSHGIGKGKAPGTSARGGGTHNSIGLYHGHGFVHKAEEDALKQTLREKGYAQSPNGLARAGGQAGREPWEHKSGHKTTLVYDGEGQFQHAEHRFPSHGDVVQHDNADDAIEHVNQVMAGQ